MYTNITSADQIASMTFSKLIPNRSFNLVVSNVILRTEQKKVITRSDNSLSISGSVNGDSLMLTDVVGNVYITSPSSIIKETFNDNDVLRTNIIKMKTGVPEETFLGIYLSRIYNSIYRRSKYSNPIVYKDRVFQLDVYSKYIYVFDTKGNLIHRIYIYGLIGSYCYHIFDGGDGVYITSRKDTKSLYKVSKDDIYENNLSEERIEKLVLDNQTSKNFNFTYYLYDFVTVGTKIFFTAAVNGIHVIDTELCTITEIKSSFTYNAVHQLLIKDNDVYVIGGSSEKTIYKISQIEEDLNKLEAVMSHPYYLTSTYKQFVMVNDKIFGVFNSVIFDIAERKSYSFPTNIPRVYKPVAPMFIDDTIVYSYDSYWYSGTFQPYQLDKDGDTTINFDEPPCDLSLINFVTDDIGVGYNFTTDSETLEVNPELSEITSTGISGSFAFKFVAMLDEEVSEIQETVTIKKDAVSPDKLLTYVYKV